LGAPFLCRQRKGAKNFLLIWIPAFAGMTVMMDAGFGQALRTSGKQWKEIGDRQNMYFLQLVKSRLPPRADTPKIAKRQAIEGQRALARSIGIGLGFEILSAEAELGVNYVQAVEKVIPIGQYLSA